MYNVYTIYLHAYLSLFFNVYIFLFSIFQAGADPNLRSTSGRSLLQEACIGGHPNVVRLLVEFVDDVDAVDKEGQSACHAAGFHGEVECLEVLKDKGKDILSLLTG